MTSVSSSKVCRSRIVFSSSWYSKVFAGGGRWAGDDVDVVVASGMDCSSFGSISEGGEDGACCCCCCC